MSDQIRWGVLGTANIARVAFLPALRAAGGGAAYAVASRTVERAREWAEQQEIEHAYGCYEDIVEDDAVDAVYNPLPNSLHEEWTIAALRAGKAVLCEKPMCVSAAETVEVLDVARETGVPLWEAFVFPFHHQMERLRVIIASGALGEVREVHSAFHFEIHRSLKPAGRSQNIRLSAELAGGATMDVGCYCIRLGRLVFDAEAIDAAARARWAPEGVDEDLQGILSFPGDRRLLLSCGMRMPRATTFSRVIGAEGEVRMTNPFHPREGDTLEVLRNGAEPQTESADVGAPTFTPAIQHIHRVLRGEEAPRHLAADEALGNAVAIDMLLASAREARSG